jgi:hypothetical protein
VDLNGNLQAGLVFTSHVIGAGSAGSGSAASPVDGDDH